MGRILIVDDDADVWMPLADRLRRTGHEDMLALSGATAIDRASADRPDVVVVDTPLPDAGGEEVCRRLGTTESTRHIPVILVSPEAREEDRISGFLAGATDYVTKPFSARELVLRVGAVVRRVEAARTDRIVHVGGLRVDKAARRTWVDGREVQLANLEFALLVALCESGDTAQTRADLLVRVWGREAGVDPRTVDAHMTHLRHKIGRAGAYIQTIRRVGYRFVGSDLAPRPRGP